MRDTIKAIMGGIAILCVFIVVVFGYPRANSPNSLRQVRVDGVSHEEARIAKTMSEANLNDAKSGTEYTGQVKSMGELVLSAGMFVFIIIPCGLGLFVGLGTMIKLLLAGVQYGNESPGN